MKSRLNKIIIAIPILIAFIGFYMVSKNVFLYGDDFFYYQFGTRDISYFVQRHVEHYFLANGRAIVHILVTIFLQLDLNIWRIFLPLMMASIVMMSMLLTNEKNRLKTGIICVSLLFFVHVIVGRQSIYWLTGSFNYVYPYVILLLFIVVLFKKIYLSKRVLFVIIAFLAATSVEQNSVMAFGTLFLYIGIDFVFEKKKPEKILIITLIIMFLGVCSVVLAPGQFYRASLEDVNTISIDLVLDNIKHLSKLIYMSIYSKVYIITLGITSIYIIITNTSKINNVFEKIIILISISGFATSYISKLNLGLLIYALIGSSLLFFYASILVYKNRLVKYRKLPVILVIIGFGSQLMLIISPVYGYRTLIPLFFTIVVYMSIMIPSIISRHMVFVISIIIAILLNNPFIIIISIIALLIDILFDYKNLKAIPYILIIISSLIFFNVTIQGYKTNAQIYNKNIAAVTDNSKLEIVNYYLPLNTYCWVMPYNNEYYTPYYQMYMTKNNKSKIIWKLFK